VTTRRLKLEKSEEREEKVRGGKWRQGKTCLIANG